MKINTIKLLITIPLGLGTITMFFLTRMALTIEWTNGILACGFGLLAFSILLLPIINEAIKSIKVKNK